MIHQQLRKVFSIAWTKVEGVASNRKQWWQGVVVTDAYTIRYIALANVTRQSQLFCFTVPLIFYNTRFDFPRSSSLFSLPLPLPLPEANAVFILACRLLYST